VIAQNYPTIFLLIAIDARDDVPDRFGHELDVSLQVHAHGVRAAEVIRKRQSALETLRPHFAAERLEQVPRVAVGDRLDRNTGKVGRLFFSESRGAGY